MNENSKKRKFHFSVTTPPLGMRIIKTAIAVFLCLMIYVLRGYNGMVSQSVIAAIICMQPYISDSKTFALNRIGGTLMGAFWGLAFLWLMKYVPILSTNMVLVYAIMSVGVVIVFYSAVLFNMTDFASLCAITFLCVIIGYPDVEAPVLQTLDRIIDTVIGVCVSVAVNVCHLPRKKHPERVFFIGLHDLTGDRFARVSSRVLIELNRLYDEGAKICIESTWAPAFVLTQMEFLKINMPVIVMDGAALYDITENAFLHVVEIQKQSAEILQTFLLKEKRGYCMYIIRENTMITFLRGELNEAELSDYHLMKRSPYRNYVQGHYHEEDKVAVIRTLVHKDEADEFERKFKASAAYSHFRYVRRQQPRFNDYVGFYFYHPLATIQNMELTVIKNMPASETLVPVHILPDKKRYDPQKYAPHMLRKVRSLYAPNIFMRDPLK